MKHHIIELRAEEETIVNELLRRGKHVASVRNRAQVLLLSHRGLTDLAIEQSTGVKIRSVRRIRKRYVTQGFKRCLYGLPRPGRPRTYDTTYETELTALACSSPPDGSSRWTLELLRQRMDRLACKATVHLLLKKTNASRGDKKCGASGR